jgi:hypothetical protein
MLKRNEVMVVILSSSIVVGFIVLSLRGNSPKDAVEVLGSLALIITLPVALLEYGNAQYATKAEREEAAQNYTTEIYHALDEKYVEYLTLCFDHPDLDIWDLDNDNSLDKDSSLNMPPDRRKKELIAFEILICIFERAFLTYSGQSSESKKRYWVGWDAYIKFFSKRKDFSYAWGKFGFSFDEEFQNYMNKITETSYPP